MNPASPPDANPDHAEPAARLLLRDAFRSPLRTIAGFHVGADGDGLCAATVLLDADSLELLDAQRVHQPAPAGVVDDDDRALAALAALLAASRLLGQIPDLALVDGHGIAHPQRFGLASRFGVATGLPSIGVADRLLIGAPRMSLHEMRGAFAPLRDGRDQIGWLLRSQPGTAPLVVSPGHRVALASAPGLVMRCIRDQHLPEPILLARRLAARDGGGRMSGSVD